MCTASWLQEDGGYQLLFNRDEKRTRLPAMPPRAEWLGGLLTIAPTDAGHGGTWITANEAGLTICLLNGDNLAPGARSRGLLVRDLAGAASIREATAQLRQTDLAPYAAFTLLLLEPNLAPRTVAWDSSSGLRFNEATQPLTSSSFDAAGARSRRLDDYRRLTACAPLDTARLSQFHQSHRNGPSAYSTCMHRADAETVSFSWIQVTPNEVSFFYTPAAPCRWVPGETLTIPRAAKGAALASPIHSDRGRDARQ